MTAFSWDSPTFGAPGTNVHVGTTVDDAHTVSEDRAEAAR